MEEHNQKGINLFEKVIVTAKRAKKIYELEEDEKARLEHKPTFQAILETNEGRIRYQRPDNSLTND
jgi:DNA-directed RNA polymerase subunit K/omega